MARVKEAGALPRAVWMPLVAAAAASAALAAAGVAVTLIESPPAQRAPLALVGLGLLLLRLLILAGCLLRSPWSILGGTLLAIPSLMLPVLPLLNPQIEAGSVTVALSPASGLLAWLHAAAALAFLGAATLAVIRPRRK